VVTVLVDALAVVPAHTETPMIDATLAPITPRAVVMRRALRAPDSRMFI
jgi:hypothetical protein